MQLLNTPGPYLSGQAEQQQQSFQQMTQEVMSTYSQLFNIPISYAKEGLRDAQFPIEGYDELAKKEVIAGRGYANFLEAVMNSIRNSLGMPETEIAREPSRLWNPHFYAIFAQVHNTLYCYHLGPWGKQGPGT